MLELKHKELYIIKSDILRNILTVLIHYNLFFMDHKSNLDYSVFYDVLEKAVDNAFKEVDDIWMD